jgi:hypothetical protein
MPTLVQAGYIWQRDWTSSVKDSLNQAQGRMDSVVVLGGEIVWKEKTPEFVRANVDWLALKALNISSGMALRIAPQPALFSGDQSASRFLEGVVRSLVTQATEQGVPLTEFQIDFDCPQKDLASYGRWLRKVRPTIQPFRLVVTTLPAWLEEREFAALVGGADDYVLQVHSIPTSSDRARNKLCDSGAVRVWIRKAAKLGLPFSVALPTYRCEAGYGPSGKLLGVAMDSVQPVWPPGTRILEFETDADEMAALVQEWRKNRPPELRRVLWYRLPVATDTRNWRWPTLCAVMSGRSPVHQLEVLQEGENPIDVSVKNTGEADEQLNSMVTASWHDTALVTADALKGWTLSSEKDQAVFKSNTQFRVRLSPGAKRKIGWLRFERPPSLHLEIAKQNEAPH